MNEFYKYAAGLANNTSSFPDFAVDFFLNEIEHEGSFSSLLEPKYQETVLAYKSSGSNKAIEAGMPFMEPLNATNWHEMVTMAANSQKKLGVGGKTGKKSWHLNVSEIAIFSSHRLKNKSYQIKSDIDPKIRYFHSILIGQKEGAKLGLTSYEFLYWLANDLEGNIVKGNFIDYNGRLKDNQPWAIMTA